MKPGYKQTEVGVIPEDWEVKGLLDVVRIAKGQVDPKIEPYRSMPLVAPDHIQSGTGRLLEVRTAEEQRAISGKYLFGPGDIVYSKIRPYLRKAVLADFAGLCSADMYPLRPVGETSGRFILEGLLAYRFTKYAESVSVRSGMPKINRNELADFQLAVPTDPLEQRAIAEALADVDAVVAGLEGLIAKKRDLKQAAMQQLLTGQTRLPGFSGAWEVKRLGEVAPFQRGFDLPTSQVQSGSVPVVYSNGILNHHNFAMAKGPGIVTGRSGTIGEVTYVESDYWPHNTSLWVTRFNGNHPRFLFYLYSTIDFDRLSSGSGVPTLNRNDLHDVELRIPLDHDEQTAVATVLSDMDAEVSALQAQLDKTRLIKQAMMQELLTGRTRLPFK